VPPIGGAIKLLLLYGLRKFCELSVAFELKVVVEDVSFGVVTEVTADVVEAAGAEAPLLLFILDLREFDDETLAPPDVD
jgi:hypothetical protein